MPLGPTQAMPRTIAASAHEAAVPPPIAGQYLPALALLHCLASFVTIQRFVILLLIGPSMEVATGRVSSHHQRALPSVKGNGPTKAVLAPLAPILFAGS
jgi:hypothetical protein